MAELFGELAEKVAIDGGAGLAGIDGEPDRPVGGAGWRRGGGSGQCAQADGHEMTHGMSPWVGRVEVLVSNAGCR
jgi:hypothetical protein